MAVDRRVVSKRLSYVLRHDPASVGMQLDPGGWVDIETLLAALAAHGTRLSRPELDALVAGGDKQRFVVSDGCIRAAHGHSVAVDLGYRAEQPPAVLWHGTSQDAVESILATGLSPRSRRQVHLSSDVATARTVGARHGRPVVLAVDAGRMAADGHRFYRSTSGIWLTARVPAGYVSRATVEP